MYFLEVEGRLLCLAVAARNFGVANETNADLPLPAEAKGREARRSIASPRCPTIGEQIRS